MSILAENKSYFLKSRFYSNLTSIKNMKIVYFQSKMILTVVQRRTQVFSAAEIAVTPYCKLKRKS